MSNFFFTLPRRKIEAPQIALGEIPSARQDRSLLGFESSDSTSSTTSTDQSLSLESVDLPYLDNNFSLRPSSIGSSAESTESADSASSANTRSSNESTQVLRSERSQREFINILEGVRLRKATDALLIAARALLTLLFLLLLLRKMQGRLQMRGDYPWILILAPLYTGNLLRIGPSLFSGSHFYPDTSFFCILRLLFISVATSTELVRLHKVVRLYRDDPEMQRIGVIFHEAPREAMMIFIPAALDLVDNIGEFLATILIGFLLDGKLSISTRVALFPIWIQVLCGSLIRCYSYSDPEADIQSRSFRQISSCLKSLGYIAYKGLPAALISLRLDGVIYIRWIILFTPWYHCLRQTFFFFRKVTHRYSLHRWLVTTGLALASCCLCCFSSTLDPLRYNESLEPTARHNFARSWNLMVKAMVFYLLVVDALAILFLLRLANRLDGKSKGSWLALLSPLFLLYGFTFLLSPPLVLVNAKIDEIRRNTESTQIRLPEANNDDRQFRATEIYNARRARRLRRPIMQIASQSIFFLRHSSTVFKRTKYSHELSECSSHEYDDSKPCYVCMSNPSNGILMECGHGGLCYECAIELARKSQPCPLCRSLIQEVVHIDSMNSLLGVVWSSTQVTVKHRHHNTAGNTGIVDNNQLRRNGVTV